MQLRKSWKTDAFVREHFDIGMTRIMTDVNLFDYGFVDSLAPEIVFFIEENFGIEITQKKISPSSDEHRKRDCQRLWPPSFKRSG